MLTKSEEFERRSQNRNVLLKLYSCMYIRLRIVMASVGDFYRPLESFQPFVRIMQMAAMRILFASEPWQQCLHISHR
jgi:hypothetical protein